MTILELLTYVKVWIGQRNGTLQYTQYSPVVDGYYSSSLMSFEWLGIFSLIWEATVVENKLATKESLSGHLPYGGRPLKFSTTLPRGGGHDHLYKGEHHSPTSPGFWEVMDLLPYKWAVMRMNVRSWAELSGF
jgi:hypothetical protein